MNRFLRGAQGRFRSAASPARGALLHAGVVAVHAVLVPYHLATEVHLSGGGVPAGHAAAGEHGRFHFCAGHHGAGGGNHTPHAASDHGREGTRPDPAVACAGDAVAPPVAGIPREGDAASPGVPVPPLLPPQGTRPGPRCIRGPPSSPMSLPS